MKYSYRGDCQQGDNKAWAYQKYASKHGEVRNKIRVAHIGINTLLDKLGFLIFCLVWAFTIKFLVINVPRKINGRSMIKSLSVIFKIASNYFRSSMRTSNAMRPHPPQRTPTSKQPTRFSRISFGSTPA